MEPLYRKLQNDIKTQIIAGVYREGDLLPSESELQLVFDVTRSTVRQALGELEKEGYIQKKQGKGSVVKKHQRRTLGLLSVKGFSEAVSSTRLAVSTVMITKPVITHWQEQFFYTLSELEKKAGCIYMKRVRCVEDEPVMLEATYIPNLNLPRFCTRPFVNGSLFETLTTRYAIEITRVDQDLRAVGADRETAAYLKIEPESPLLLIFLKFHTNREYLSVYSSLLCNTDKYSIGNKL